MTKRVGLATVLSAIALAPAELALGQTQLTRADYARAEAMLPTNAAKLVLRDHITPNWIAGTDRFWYRVSTPVGVEFVYVDPARRLKRPAFDHARLAQALVTAADTTVKADSLPFQTLEWREAKGAVTVVVPLRGKSWQCDLVTYRCEAAPAKPAPNPNESVSPNGQWAVLAKDHNLWLRNVATGDQRALTTDGARRYDYGSRSEANTTWISEQRLGTPSPPVVLWTADSKRLLTFRLDQRNVREQHLVQSAMGDSVRPKLWTFAFPHPGDSAIATASWRVFDIPSGKMTVVSGPPVPSAYDSPLIFRQAWWADSSGTRAYYVHAERGGRAWSLREIDPSSGATAVLAEERAPHLVEPAPQIGMAPQVKVLGNGRELIWYSERDGWARFYLSRRDQTPMTPLTQGPWRVREIVAVDEIARTLWFTGAGRESASDPYYRQLYRVNLDGTGLALLSSEDADHEITASPTGAWFVDRYSRVDLAPVTVLRSGDGKTVIPLERADITRLLATGWRYPERFSVKADDDSTTLYGIIIKPSTFDSTRRYPVLEDIYPGPQVNRVPKGFEPGADHRALVELGFVGVQVDGRGTPFRSKAFHLYSYGKLENGGGLEDHVATFKQLGLKHRYLDLDRIGIYGHSGGGFASARAMLLYPDVYKVAVSSAGNHDQRGYLSLWGETYQGMPAGDNYRAQSNAEIAKNLQGKMMLAFGDLDDNVPPALTIQLIHALTKANKDYDLLIVPNGHHGMLASGYFRRRRWDYFVTHLMGAKPPVGYEVTTPPEYPFER